MLHMIIFIFLEGKKAQRKLFVLPVMFGVFSSSASFTESRQRSWRRAAFLLDLAEGKNSQQDLSIATGGRHLSAAGGDGETNRKFSVH